MVKHSLIVGYADDHTLLKIISDKSNCVTAAFQINAAVTQLDLSQLNIYV